MKRLLPRKNLSKHKTSLSEFTPKFDYPLLLTVLLLTTIGLVMVYDASVVQAFSDFGDKFYYIKQQILWAALGLVLLVFFSWLDYKHLRTLAPYIFFGSIILLLAVLIPGLGVAAGGAHRWLKVGPVTVQPAEIVKLATIIFLAALFEKRIRNVPFLLITGIITGILGILQRDLGSAIVYFSVVTSIYVVAGARLIYLIALVPVSLIGFLLFVFSSAYRKKRVLAFLDPFSDPQGYTYHISQVLIAIGSGSWFGLGLGQSRQKFEYIPEVTTDSIFAIVGEEFGFAGSIFLILLIAYFIYRGFKIVEKTQDKFGKYLAFGLISWLGVQSIINISAMVALIPLTGVPLPFISYGGSALLTNLVAVGILLNISKHYN